MKKTENKFGFDRKKELKSFKDALRNTGMKAVEKELSNRKPTGRKGRK